MTSKRQTLEQKRAAAAWDQVSQVPDAERGEYKTRARDLPAMIQINGLGSTMAFLLSKPKNVAYKLIYEHISEWVTKQMPDPNNPQRPYSGRLMDLIRTEDMNLYRRATTEAIEYGIWLKRYVESWE